VGKLLSWFNNLKDITATIITIVVSIILIAIAFWVKPYGWRIFAVISPTILCLIGGRFIVSKFEEEKLAQKLLNSVTAIATILSAIEFILEETSPISFAVEIVKFLFNYKPIIICILLFIALSSPLCRLVERQTQRLQRPKEERRAIARNDVKYWVKDSLLTNLSGWIAMCLGVLGLLYRNPEIIGYEPLDNSISNAFTSIMCTVPFLIILHNTYKQISDQKNINNMDKNRPYNDDKDKNFSLTSVAQWTNLIWLWCVGFIIITVMGILFCYTTEMHPHIALTELLSLSFFVLPFFVVCSLGPEHNWVYTSVFVVATPAVLFFQALYIYLSWDHNEIVYLWRLAIPICFLIGYLIYLTFRKKMKIGFIEKPTISCLVYLFAALPSIFYYSAFVVT